MLCHGVSQACILCRSLLSTAAALLATPLLAIPLLTGCADPQPPSSVHDAADHMFLDLVLIARRNTLPTQSDATLLIKAADQIRSGKDACAQWKLDRMVAIGMPLVMQVMTADAAGQQQVRRDARRQLQQASAMEVPDDLCHGRRFPPATFN